jgi:hypothetical protein
VLFPLHAATKEAVRRYFYAAFFFGDELEVTICDFKCEAPVLQLKKN